MDDADRAQSDTDLYLDREIQAARALIPPTPRTECLDCCEDLEPHRQAWGLCIACKAKRERRDRMRATGA
jgi:hypothetical protein